MLKKYLRTKNLIRNASVASNGLPSNDLSNDPKNNVEKYKIYDEMNEMKEKALKQEP